MKTEIEIKQEQGHYVIYYCGVFYCTCDPGELSGILDKLSKGEED